MSFACELFSVHAVDCEMGALNLQGEKRAPPTKINRKTCNCATAALNILSCFEHFLEPHSSRTPKTFHDALPIGLQGAGNF